MTVTDRIWFFRAADAGAGAAAGDDGTAGAGAAGGDAGAAGDAAGGDGTAGGGSWRDALSDDLREHPAIANIKSIEELAKEHVNAQRVIGKKGVVPPGENATQEELDQFYNALGRPETPDDYTLQGFEPPEGVEWDDNAQTEALKGMHALGLTDAQAAGAMKLYGEYVSGLLGAQADQVHEQTEQAEAALKKEFGDQFDAKMDRLNRAVSKFGDESLVEQFKKTGFGRNPAFVKFFDRILEAAHVGEGDGTLPSALAEATGGASSLAEVERQISEIRGQAANDPKHPYNDRKNPEHQAIHRKMTQLYEARKRLKEGVSQ